VEQASVLGRLAQREHRTRPGEGHVQEALWLAVVAHHHDAVPQRDRLVDVRGDQPSELLELFAESGRNVVRTSILLRDLLADCGEDGRRITDGSGIAVHTCNHGAGSASASGMGIVTSDGSLQAISASNDIGPGQRTLQTMIAAETVGIPLERTSIAFEVDTEFSSDCGGTNGSRQTNTAGWGMYEAGLDAKRQLQEWGAKKLMDDASKATPPR